jgi:acetyl-CoA carboxylase biotin carboxyl carrier protein
MEPSAENKIKELLAVAKAHSLAEMSFQENGLRVSFRRNNKANPAVSKAAPSANGKHKESAPVAPVIQEEIIKSPMVGTFRRSLSKDHPPMVLEGNHVKPGDKMAVVECMKIPNEVVSFAVGVVSKILVEDGQAVEYGQPLFSIELNKGNQN